jgi:hypothetical protein
MQTQEIQFMLWLKAILTDEKRREMLRMLMQQYELPVIESKAFKKGKAHRATYF